MRKLAKTQSKGWNCHVGQKPCLRPNQRSIRRIGSVQVVCRLPSAFHQPSPMASSRQISHNRTALDPVLCRAARPPVLRARAVQLCAVILQWKQRRMQPGNPVTPSHEQHPAQQARLNFGMKTRIDNYVMLSQLASYPTLPLVRYSCFSFFFQLLHFVPKRLSKIYKS